MSTLWDHAVRAVNTVLDEQTGAGRWPADRLSYFCGGPERRCEHRTCTVVCALADADLLDYAAGDAVPFTQLDRVTRVVGLALGETGTTAMCHVNLECSHTPCEIVRRLLARNVLATGAPVADPDEHAVLAELARYWADNPNVRIMVASRAKRLRDLLDTLLGTADTRPAEPTHDKMLNEIFNRPAPPSPAPTVAGDELAAAATALLDAVRNDDERASADLLTRLRFAVDGWRHRDGW